jgi:hypothetical protein
VHRSNLLDHHASSGQQRLRDCGTERLGGLARSRRWRASRRKFAFAALDAHLVETQERVRKSFVRILGSAS